jgi:hypothetical protein
MTTHSDLIRLSKTGPTPVVSFFLPTSPRGAETLDSSLQLKVLRKEALVLLKAKGLTEPNARELLSPIETMESDRELWQHQKHGLAIFLRPTGVETISLSASVDASVYVGESCELLPLIPHVQPDGEFLLLALSQDAVQLFRGDHEGLEKVDVFGMPDGIDGVLTEDDYQNPAYAAPPARPNLGHTSMSHAQVYGQAPPEWKKTLRERYVEHISRALNGRLAGNSVPTVLVADEELAGLVGARFTFSHVNTTHPNSFDHAQLHALGWDAVASLVDQKRHKDLSHFERNQGLGTTAITDILATATAASEGRVELLLVASDAPHPDISALIVPVLNHGGRVVYAPELAPKLEVGVGALLRY